MLNLPGDNAAPIVAAEPSGALSTSSPIPGLSYSAFSQQDADVRRFWRALWRRRKLLVAVFACFFIAVTAFTVVHPKHYTTAVKLIAGSTAQADANTDTTLPVLNALLSQGGVQSSETYAELLHETPIATEVIDQLKLPIEPGALLAHVAIKPVTNTNIITVSVTWPNRDMSARIANAFAGVFVDHERKLISRQADSVLSFLQQELPQAQSHMRSAQNALAAYEVRSGITDLQQQTQDKVQQLAALDTSEQNAELEARAAQAQLASIASLLAQTPQTIVGQRDVAQNPVTSQLDQQISQTEVDLNAARQQYTDSHPLVQSLRQKLAELEKERSTRPSLVTATTQNVPNPVYQQLKQQQATMQAQLAAQQANASTVRSQKIAMQPALSSLPEKSRRIGDLQREAKSAESVYTALEQKYQDALIARTTALSDVTITQPADPAAATISPNVPFNLALAAIIGLILAVSTVLVVEYFDDRFRDEEEVKERLGLPVLATIPRVDLADSKTSAWVQPLSVESFFQLVAALRYSSSKPPRVIAVTSPEQSDGKSTIAVNTAISMASMHARVLVVDADLRRPTIHTKLGIDNDRGLSDVLVGALPLGEAVKPTEHEGVWALTSGRRAPNPVALLQSDSFDKLLIEAREHFDVVILDTPALRSIVDSVVLSVKAEGTVLVVSSARSSGRTVRNALAKLRSVRTLNLLGVVLNEAKPEATDYSDYYLGSGQTLTLPAASAH